MERGTKDGYNTAVVEFLRDEIPTGQDLEGRVFIIYIYTYGITFTAKLICEKLYE